MDGPAEVLALAGATVELHRSRVVRGEDVLPLTRTEVDLLRYLAARAGRVVERRELLTEVWGWRARSGTRALDATVMRLRRKIEVDPDAPVSLLTAHGFGYRLTLSDPGPAPGLVGRAREWAALERWSGPGITVIVGPGGVGKTTLVSRWRERAEAAAPGSTRFVSLAGADDREAVVAAVAARLGVPNEAGIRGAWRSCALVVLDAADAAPDAAVELARSHPGRVVVTTRVHPRAAGLDVLELTPLDPAPAAALFVERARRLDPGFAPTAASTVTIERIVERVDRLPLAIELAAARVGLLGLAELSERLKEPLRVLRGADGGRGLDEVVALSWTLLDDDARSVLIDAVVLGGRCDFGLLEALAPGRDPLAAVEALHRASLVATGPEGARVFDLVREWVAARAPAEALAEARRRRDRALTHLAAQPRTALERLRFAREHGAPLLAVALDPDASDEAVAACAEAAVADPGVAGLRSLVTRRGIDAAARLGRSRTELELRSRRATAAREAGHTAEAEVDLDAIDRVAARSGEPRLAACAAHARGRSLLSRDDEGALALLTTARDALEALGDGEALARVSVELGTALRRVGRPDEAAAAWTSAASLAAVADDPTTRALALVQLAQARNTGGHHADAQSLLEEALAAFRVTDDRVNQAITWANLGNTHTRRGELTEALRCLTEAVGLQREVGSIRGEAYTLANRAAAHELLGHLASAEVDLSLAAELASATDDRSVQSFAFSRLGEVRLVLGRFAEAAEALRRASQLAPPHLRTQVATALVGALAAAGEVAEAQALLAEVRDAAPAVLVGVAEGHLRVAAGAPLEGVEPGLDLVALSAAELRPRLDALRAHAAARAKGRVAAEGGPGTSRPR
jgi:tetratricopeptide (TPR) repeat protein